MAPRNVETGKSTVLNTTAHHPFWDATDRKWVDAAKLQAGHRLLVHDAKRLEGDGTGAGSGGGGPPAIVTVAKVHSFTGSALMRDLTVATLHTYYVLTGTTPILVHNNNGIPCATTTIYRVQTDHPLSQRLSIDDVAMSRSTEAECFT